MIDIAALKAANDAAIKRLDDLEAARQRSQSPVQPFLDQPAHPRPKDEETA